MKPRDMKNQKRKLNYFLFYFFWLVVFALMGFGLTAVPAKAVTISQLTVEINAQPGETIEQIVQLYDDSLQGVTVYPWVYNFTEDPNKEGAALVLTDPKDLKPDRGWVKFEGNRIELPADGSLVDFPYRLEVPQNAEPGSHLISLVFRSRPPTPEERGGSTILIGTNVVTNIFLKVAGATIDKIEADFRVGEYANKDVKLSAGERKAYFKPKQFFVRPPVEFLLTIHNQGNTHQKPDGNVRIVNDLGLNAPEKLLVNPDNRIILPGTDRTFEVPTYGQGFMVGKYRAKLTLLYGNPLRSLTKEVTFWIIPLYEIMAGLLFISLLLAIRWAGKVRREYKEWKREKERERKEAEREKEREYREIERERRLREEIIKDIKGSGPQPPPANQPPAGEQPFQPPEQSSGNQ